MKKILIIGATSAIAKETAYNFAAGGDAVFLLAGRDANKLDIVKLDLMARYGVEVHTDVIDVLNYDSHPEFFKSTYEKFGGIDILLIAHGSLTEENITQDNVNAIIREYEINALSVFSLATTAAKIMQEQGRGTIAVISSVAGERGRKSNYIYGSAKAAVTKFLEGLRHKMYAHNVNIITIKPGQVDTPMTQNMPKGFLFAKPKVVGKDIFDAIQLNKPVIYTPRMWQLIMCIVRNIPEAIFKRLNF